MSKPEQRVRRRRTDAIENENRVRSAAMQVFLRRGHAMTMDEVAVQAGVSKGTVYNTYPTRQDLIDETVVEFLDESEVRYRDAMATLPAWDALVKVILTDTIGVASTAEVLDPNVPDGPVARALDRLNAALTELLEKGKAEGSIRPEITVDHMKTLSRGLYMVLPDYSPERAQTANEYMSIVLRGLHT